MNYATLIKVRAAVLGVLPSVLLGVLPVVLSAVLTGCATPSTPSQEPRSAPNILVITVDDMNADSVGAFGSRVADITPNIDQLAQGGLRFEHAHVQVANCMPSRNVMWSGRYPHTNRVEGFIQVRDPGYLTLSQALQQAGYFTAIRHKVRDSTPYMPFPWDRVLDEHHPGGKPHRKDPASYGLSVSDGIASAAEAGKPFYLLINIADPHLPFYGLTKKGEPVEDSYVPSRVYAPHEVTVPGFLPDHPTVREELAHYYSSVRRADDAVGAILRALEASGKLDNTLVLFVSDHGMPFPFSKTQLYHHSTRTPLIVRWPGRVAAGKVDERHMVSAVDFLPTIVEAAGAPIPDGVQGRSFLPLLLGDNQAGRDAVFKVYNQNSAGQRTPMRALETQGFLYIFNPWSDGRRVLHSATHNMNTYRHLKLLARDDPDWEQRLDHLRFRSPEEFYDLSTDPDCRVNRIDDPALQEEVSRHRQLMEDMMLQSSDHALAAMRGRENPGQLSQYMAEQEALQNAQKQWIRTIRERMQRK